MPSSTLSDPDLDQRRQALEIANRCRLAGSQVRREIAAGTLSLADALDDPRAQQSPIGRLVLAQPRWGEQKASRLFRRLEMWPQRRVRDLTDRQRTLIKAATR
jgi:hypothetical protein